MQVYAWHAYHLFHQQGQSLIIPEMFSLYVCENVCAFYSRQTHTQGIIIIEDKYIVMVLYVIGQECQTFCPVAQRPKRKNNTEIKKEGRFRVKFLTL